ncbi:hypothetical protein V8E53_013530 [Lactarius tabidus]
MTSSEFDGYYVQVNYKHRLDQARRLTPRQHGLSSLCRFKPSQRPGGLLEQGHIHHQHASQPGFNSRSSRSAKGNCKARVRDENDFMDHLGSLIVELVDQLFGRADIALDQFSGRTKAPPSQLTPQSLYRRRPPKVRRPFYGIFCISPNRSSISAEGLQYKWGRAVSVFGT